MDTNNKTTITAEPGKQELYVEREFEAPRDLVFRAHTDPGLYAQWLGPRGLETSFEVFEPRTGGQYRFIQKDEDGNVFAFRGVNHLVKAPELLIGTFEFEGLPEEGHVSMETLRLEELPGGRTKLRAQSVFQSVEDRDGMIASGMEQGINEGYERLDEVLEKL